MNRAEFGVLVACLRDDLRWSQAELAEKSDVGLATLNEVESGRRRDLMGDDVLIRLANGLQLTSLERREFLLAASGVTAPDVMRPDIGSQQRQFDIAGFLRQLGEYIALMRLPAFVTDSFCDILLANKQAIDFYKPPAGMMEEAGKMVGGFNQMNYVFHRDSNFQSLIDEGEWDSLALINIRHFRRRTLRFRHKSYCSALIKHFLNTRRYPYFERYWRKVAFEIDDDNFLRVGNPWAEKTHGFVETETLLALTPYGELYVHQLSPLNQATLKEMAARAKTLGKGYREFARLPDRRKE